MVSIIRVYNLIKRDLIIPFAIPNRAFFKNSARKVAVWRYALWLPLFAMIMGILYCTHSPMNESPELGPVYGIIFAIVLPYVITREHCKRSNREFALLLPATATEKCLAFAILSLIILPLYSIVSSCIGYYIGMILGNGIFKGTFVVSYIHRDLAVFLSPFVISLMLMIISLNLLLSLLIKNEIVQMIGLFLVFAILGIFPAVLAILKDVFLLPFLTGKTAIYLIYPLISTMLLLGSYVKLKEERA
ncbi:MAG: hypothetical protein IJ681_09160 [Bacteroidales bacterium]|nr:hypothetical protein [Bacteroidales bacterium]